MSQILKVITIVAATCPLTLAADCQSHPELCRAGFDETSLMQIKHTAHIGADQQPQPLPADNSQPAELPVVTTKTVVTETTSEFSSTGSSGEPEGNFTLDNSSGAYQVEMAQNDLKEAQSNTSIQMYAASVARLNLAKSIWAAAKATANMKGATLKEIKAERIAAAALQAAQDEADAWQTAVAAQKDADLQAGISESDAAAKHAIMLNASKAAANATAFRKAAEATSEQTKTVQQQLVNDAAAEASATFAHDSKVAAAEARAEQKEAAAQAAAMAAAKVAAQKEAKLKANQAWKDEWSAHLNTQKAQAAAIKAAGASVTDDLMGQVANYSATLNVSLLEQPELVGENDTELDIIAANASAAVQAAEYAVSEAASDEKKYKAAYDVAKYAADKSAAAMKSSQSKADSAYAAAVAAGSKAAKLARESRQAQEGINDAAWKLGHANASNLTATFAVGVAENATYNQAAMVRTVKDAESAAAANVKSVTDTAMRQKVLDGFDAADADAQASAEQAASSRIVSEYQEFQEEKAQGVADEANANLTEANADFKDANKVANEAESHSVHAANQAQKWDELSAAATIAEGVNTTAPDTPEEDVAGSSSFEKKTIFSKGPPSLS